jgi:hypothetical protein
MSNSCAWTASSPDPKITEAADTIQQFATKARIHSGKARIVEANTIGTLRITGNATRTLPILSKARVVPGMRARHKISRFPSTKPGFRGPTWRKFCSLISRREIYEAFSFQLVQGVPKETYTVVHLALYFLDNFLSLEMRDRRAQYRSVGTHPGSKARALDESDCLFIICHGATCRSTT